MLSMFTFIPIAVSVVKHSGYCLFYTDDTAYGLVGVCGYTIAVPVIFSLVYGGCMAVIAFCRMLGIVDRRSEDENVKCFILNVAFDGVTFLFMFINAGLNSGGFNSLCYNLFGSLDSSG
nr:hypothetical protein BaRGS_026446 [Batillaria attramentaria]